MSVVVLCPARTVIKNASSARRRITNRNGDAWLALGQEIIAIEARGAGIWRSAALYDCWWGGRISARIRVPVACGAAATCGAIVARRAGCAVTCGLIGRVRCSLAVASGASRASHLALVPVRAYCRGTCLETRPATRERRRDDLCRLVLRASRAANDCKQTANCQNGGCDFHECSVYHGLAK